MIPDTQRLIDQIARAPLFDALGTILETEEVTHLTEWAEVIDSANSEQWEALHIKLLSEFEDAVLAQPSMSEEAFSDCDAAAKAQLIPVVNQKITEANLLPLVAETVRVHSVIDLVLACLETEYQAIVKTQFFGQLTEWYIRGRFPCGWEGDHPDGRLVVI